MKIIFHFLSLSQQNPTLNWQFINEIGFWSGGQFNAFKSPDDFKLMSKFSFYKIRELNISESIYQTTRERKEKKIRSNHHFGMSCHEIGSMPIEWKRCEKKKRKLFTVISESRACNIRNDIQFDVMVLERAHCESERSNKKKKNIEIISDLSFVPSQFFYIFFSWVHRVT